MRRWRPQDRDAFASICSDAVVMRHYLAPLSHPETAAFIDRIEAGFDEKGFGLWALERRSDGRLLGYTGLQTIMVECPINGEVEVGWRLAHEFWGQGLAFEAASAALDFGFRQAGLARIVSMTAKTNERSLRLMERLGMRRAEQLDFDHPLIPEDHELRPHVVYTLAGT